MALKKYYIGDANCNMAVKSLDRGTYTFDLKQAYTSTSFNEAHKLAEERGLFVYNTKLKKVQA